SASIHACLCNCGSNMAQVAFPSRLNVMKSMLIGVFQGREGSAEVEPQREPLDEVAVRRIEQRDREPAALAEYGLAVRQLPKALSAVVAADARVAGAAERQVVLEDMPAPVVEGDAAGMALPQHLAPLRAVEAESVHGQRALAAPHGRQGAVEV